MSQSLRAIKRFRLRELANPQKHLLTPPATAATSSKLPPSRTSNGGSGVATLLNPFIPHKNPSSGRWAPPRYSLRRQAELIKHARASNTLHLLPPSPKMTLAATAAQLLATTTTTTTTTTVDGASNAATNSSGSGTSGLMMKKDTRTRSVEEVQQGEGEEQEGSTWLRRGWRKEVTTGSVVEWIGTVRERRVAGADIGARLYAGKKRMFKGHKWERERERREIRTKILLRDMDKRVQRFKQYRAKGKPLPLARRSSVLKKTQKLPF